MEIHSCINFSIIDESFLCTKINNTIKNYQKQYKKINANHITIYLSTRLITYTYPFILKFLQKE